MKKLRIFVLLFILTFSFSVKAEVLLEIDCDGKEISDSKSVMCEGTLLYEKEGINDIEFNYETNLNIEFSSVSGFMITNSGGKVSIHADKTLYGEIMDAAKIFEFTLRDNEGLIEKEKLTINNIVINKGNDIKVADIEKVFNITKEIIKLDDICTLDSISIEKEKIKDFHKDKFEYRDINVTNEFIFIDAVRTSNKSTATGLGTVRVPKGETIERNITVTAEDGTKKNYKLYITNISEDNEEDEVKPDQEMKSMDNTLKSLEIYNGKKKIDIGFERDKEIYNIDIKDEVILKLTIKATLNDSKAIFINNYGPRDILLKFGYNHELIKIKAEDGSEKTITININYQNKKSNDNTLSSLIINGEVVDLTNEKLVVIVPSDSEKTVIEAIPNNNKSIVKYEDIELAFGDNEVNIEVTNEDGETKEYDVNVIRENEEIVLENIMVMGYELGFSKEQMFYNLKINNDTNKLNIILSPNGIKNEILNNENLENGSKIIIKVTDDLGNYEYTINILKDNETLINIICYSVFGIGVGSLVSSIIYVINKKKVE